MNSIVKILITTISCLLLCTSSNVSANTNDTDRDGIVNAVDNCPNDTNPSQTDWNKNGKGVGSIKGRNPSFTNRYDSSYQTVA